VARVYLAGKFESLPRLRVKRDLLRRAGFTVVSTWLDEEKAAAFCGEQELTNYAKRDLAEVYLADVLILDTLDDSQTGGRDVEFGLALARGIPTVVVGPCRNIFHRLATHHYADWFWFTHLAKLVPMPQS
jgi:nucleoside 2-deoxyribosyltransferase